MFKLSGFVVRNKLEKLKLSLLYKFPLNLKVIDNLITSDSYMRPAKFDSMKLGGPFGASKRNQQHIKKKQRRGSFNSMVVANGFGREARRDLGEEIDIGLFETHGTLKNSAEDLFGLAALKRGGFESMNFGAFGTSKRSAEPANQEADNHRNNMEN